MRSPPLQIGVGPGGCASRRRRRRGAGL